MKPAAMVTVHTGTRTCTVGSIEGHIPCDRAAKWNIRSVSEAGRSAKADWACTLHLATICAGRLKP